MGAGLNAMVPALHCVRGLPPVSWLDSEVYRHFQKLPLSLYCWLIEPTSNLRCSVLADCDGSV